MNGWRDEYTQFEWLQMGLLLVGMPIAAFFGALLGMAGRWKQGRVLTAALVGMCGAAIISVALFVTFLSLPLLVTGARPRMLLDVFDGLFGEQLTRKALLGTGVISVLAAIGLRLRYRDPATRVASISMRQLLLLQLFSFIALGCWTGMRFVALDSVSGTERASRKWNQREWIVTGNSDGGPQCATRNLLYGMGDQTYENESLRALATEPWLSEIRMSGVLSPEDLDFSVFGKAKSLKTLSIELNSLIRQKTIDELGKITSLESITLSGGDFTATDFTPLSRLPKLQSIYLVGNSLDSLTLSGLSTSNSLRGIKIEYSALNDHGSLQFPKNLIALQIGSQQFPITGQNQNFAELKGLTHLRLCIPQLNGDVLRAISSLPKLSSLDLQNIAKPQDLICLLQLPALEELRFRGNVTPLQHAEYDQLLMQLAERPKLRSISCPAEVLYKEKFPTVSISSVSPYWLDSGPPGSSKVPLEESLLYWQNSDGALSSPAIQESAIQLALIELKNLMRSRIEARRDELGLGKLSINFDRFHPEIVRAPTPANAVNRQPTDEGGQR